MDILEMYKQIERIPPRKAMAILQVCHKTLYRWDKSGVLKAFRTVTNRRYYTRKQLEDFIQSRSVM